MVKSAYIHIPFCKSKCHYCSFVSFPKLDLKTDYLISLGNEIKSSYSNEKLNTLYFGGGTPSLLTLVEIENLLKYFNFDQNTEVTFEINPDDANYDYLRLLRDLEINRLSFGAQTFDDKILKLINRRHNAGQIINAVKLAQDAGFDNISLDFIYGLPKQTAGMFYDDLNLGVKLGIQHISLYGLSIEKDCYFAENPPENLADDDEQADMYLEAIEILKNLKFEHYEISNFSRKGFYSRHNLNYWNNEEYYGFGCGAHGYVNGVRYANKNILADYMKNPFKHSDERFVTDKEKLEEEIFLGFRRMSGLNTGQINAKFNIDFEEKYNDILKKYEGLNLLKKTQNGYALTPNGVLISNTILSEFIE